MRAKKRSHRARKKKGAGSRPARNLPKIDVADEIEDRELRDRARLTADAAAKAAYEAPLKQQEAAKIAAKLKDAWTR